MKEIMRLFPEYMCNSINHKLNGKWNYLQEIRLRLNKPIEFVFNDSVRWVDVFPSEKDFIFVLNQLSEFSLYRMEDELREGYMTIEGGHRVGLAGKVNTLNGVVKAIKHITFMNIRIAKEKIDSARSIIPYLYENSYLNTLLIGPPQTGKTTLIRDLTRIISTGWRHINAQKVAVIDERSEIGASIKGVPQHNLGLRTDVMDACPKAEGMMMVIRSMSPEVLIVDEIGSKQDVNALMEAINAGVTIICTIHGRSLAELKNRPSLFPIFNQRIFHRMILLKHHHTPGYVEEIYDENEVEIYRKKGCMNNEVVGRAPVSRNDNMDWI